MRTMKVLGSWPSREKKTLLRVLRIRRRPPGENFRPNFRTPASFGNVEADPRQPPIAAAETASAAASALPASDEEASTQTYKGANFFTDRPVSKPRNLSDAHNSDKNPIKQGHN